MCTRSTFSRTGVKSQDIRATTDSVHLYTQTSGHWLYTVWQYIPSNVTGSDTYFILMNTYAAGGSKSWSTQIHFVFSNNTVADNMLGNQIPDITDAAMIPDAMNCAYDIPSMLPTKRPTP